MPDPNALPSPEGSWADLLPALGIGAASLASGFAMGRNPGVDNPANVFFQALQIPAITEQRLANAQHQRDMQGYYQNLYTHQQNQDVQARLKTAVDAAKQAAEMGDTATVDSMKDQLGPYYTGLAKNARFVQQMVQQEGGMGGGQGLPTVPTLGPGAAAMPVPQGGPPQSASMGIPQQGAGDVTDIPFRPGRTRNLSIGKFSFSTQTPGTTPQESVSGWMQRRVNEGYQGVPPSWDMMMADLSKTNEARQARGLPPIAPTDRDFNFYREWQRRATPGVWQREQLQERATQVDPEVAHRMLQTPQVRGQAGAETNPFEAQRGALRRDYAIRERIAAETPKKPDAGELDKLQGRQVLINNLSELYNMAVNKSKGGFGGEPPTGPIRGRAGGIAAFMGLAPDKEVTFRSSLQTLQNTNLRETSGQNVTGPEEVRAKAAFPNVNDPPPTFIPKLRYALKFHRMADQAGRGVLSQDGLRLLHHLATPQGIMEELNQPLEEMKVIEYRTDPVSGKLVPVGQ